ncbi:hypothetical protein WN944_009443 [Citrus x changshan-huyou]|uniref:Uncharacterized protein n=1 Tax=Citrus x changshan-huyou TaxID=2935761 RepID=A0AAP0MRR4_9ROSI
MLKQAKEELQMLETQYPNRFGHLKMELKSFILLLESQQYSNNIPSCSTATTQASTNKKRKKGGSLTHEVIIEEISKCQKVEGNFKGRNRIDLVLEKAQSCLRKIQELKSSLCGS